MLSQQLIIATIISLLFSSGGPAGCRGKQNTNLQANRPSMPQTEKDKQTSAELKVLAEGFHSSVTNPFVAVIRDEETYSALAKHEATLPKLAEDFFKSHVVVAAFLGQRNTGGYSVEIHSAGNGDIRVTEKKPGKGMMLPQMITSPFKLISIERNPTMSVILTVDDAWAQKMQIYNAQGKFTMSGGFAGISEEFAIAGPVRVVRLGNLVSFAFDLSSPDERRPRRLREFATGIIDTEDRLTIQKMSADLLVLSPNPGLKAIGTFRDGQSGFPLTFASLPTHVADGYGGQGSIEATIAASP